MPGAVCVLEASGVMWAVRARGGPGSLSILSKHLQKGLGMLEAVWVVGAVGVVWAARARGGPGPTTLPLSAQPQNPFSRRPKSRSLKHSSRKPISL